MLIANKYSIIEKINSGSFGSVYKGINIRTNEPVAIKMEKSNTLLKNETNVYKYLGLNAEGIPEVKWYGLYDNKWYMVLKLLGSSLKQYSALSIPISLDIIFSLGKIMVERLRYIHSKYIIHRDVKPENFLFGPDNNLDTLYLIDFGFAKRYTQINNNNHMPISFNRSIIGTPNFISINIHDGVEPSRRDDLESIGYILLYLFQAGNLTWCNKNNAKIKELKLKCIVDTANPIEIKTFLKYCQNLEFQEKPDYNFLLEVLSQ